MQGIRKPIFPKGRNICKCCNGSGVQVNKQTGIREICKCCGGKGYMEKPINRPYRRT